MKLNFDWSFKGKPCQCLIIAYSSLLHSPQGPCHSSLFYYTLPRHAHTYTNGKTFGTQSGSWTDSQGTAAVETCLSCKPVGSLDSTVDNGWVYIKCWPILPEATKLNLDTHHFCTYTKPQKVVQDITDRSSQKIKRQSELSGIRLWERSWEAVGVLMIILYWFALASVGDFLAHFNNWFCQVLTSSAPHYKSVLHILFFPSKRTHGDCWEFLLGIPGNLLSLKVLKGFQ